MAIPDFPRGEAIHIRVKLNGNRGKISFFNWALEKIDMDWPLGPGQVARSQRMQRSVLCKDCGGWIWQRPNLRLSQVYAFARQVSRDGSGGGLKLRIRKILTADECRAAHPIQPVESMKEASAG